MVDGRVEDELRRQYIESHCVAMAEAMEHGVNVKGYFVWSLMDNFEWAEGYASASASCTSTTRLCGAR